MNTINVHTYMKQVRRTYSLRTPNMNITMQWSDELYLRLVQSSHDRARRETAAETENINITTTI